jgi:hypothetical protein
MMMMIMMMIIRFSSGKTIMTRTNPVEFWWGNLRERGHWGDPGIYGRIILR